MAYSKLEVKNNVLKGGYHLLTSDFKTRNSKRPTHNGMDFIAKNNSLDYIVAIDDGVVNYVSYDESSGYYVFIKHNNGYRSFYCHMKKDSIIVKNNQNVSKGQVIGYMGSTGHVTGAHLHFSVRDTKNNKLDPLPYLNGSKGFKNSSYPGAYPTLPTRGYFKKGDKGTEVKNLQSFLNWSNDSKISTDGIIGDKTINEVKKFQKLVNIKQDGLFGKTSLSKAKEYNK